MKMTILFKWSSCQPVKVGHEDDWSGTAGTGSRMNGWNWRNLITFSISSLDIVEKSICGWKGRPGTAGTGFRNSRKSGLMGIISLSCWVWMVRPFGTCPGGGSSMSLKLTSSNCGKNCGFSLLKTSLTAGSGWAAAGAAVICGGAADTIAGAKTGVVFFGSGSTSIEFVSISVNEGCCWVKKLLNAGCLKGVGSVAILVVLAGVTAVDNSPALG